MVRALRPRRHDCAGDSPGLLRDTTRGADPGWRDARGPVRRAHQHACGRHSAVCAAGAVCRPCVTSYALAGHTRASGRSPGCGHGRVHAGVVRDHANAARLETAHSGQRRVHYRSASRIAARAGGRRRPHRGDRPSPGVRRRRGLVRGLRPGPRADPAVRRAGSGPSGHAQPAEGPGGGIAQRQDRTRRRSSAGRAGDAANLPGTADQRAAHALRQPGHGRAHRGRGAGPGARALRRPGARGAPRLHRRGEHGRDTGRGANGLAAPGLCRPPPPST